MSLHVDSYGHAGSSTPLLLIHGWGMHGGMWRGVAERLAQHVHVLAVDLPGYGYSVGSGEWEVGSRRTESHLLLDAIVESLTAQFSEPLALCGWSLGGQVALHWARRQPRQVQRLMLVASTPCFVRRPDWEHGMSTELLEEFGAALQQDHALTLRRFLALQLRGGERERELLAVLRDELFSRGEPDMHALRTGLGILRECDLRAALPAITQPALILAGGRDRLTPLQASRYMAQQLPTARLVNIAAAAHAPFLSHTDEFVEHTLRFLHE